MVKIDESVACLLSLLQLLLAGFVTFSCKDADDVQNSRGKVTRESASVPGWISQSECRTTSRKETLDGYISPALIGYLKPVPFVNSSAANGRRYLNVFHQLEIIQWLFWLHLFFCFFFCFFYYSVQSHQLDGKWPSKLKQSATRWRHSTLIASSPWFNQSTHQSNRSVTMQSRSIQLNLPVWM